MLRLRRPDRDPRTWGEVGSSCLTPRRSRPRPRGHRSAAGSTVVPQILGRAILAIRVAGRNRAPDCCAIEADHIHNLPNLLRSYHRELLEYYLDVERPSYLEQLRRVRDTDAEVYRPMWCELERCLGRDPT
jgi:hypothetical protein